MTTYLDGIGIVNNGAQRVLTVRVATETEPRLTRTLQANLRLGDGQAAVAAALHQIADRLMQPLGPG